MSDDVESLQELTRQRAAKARERHALLAAELYRAPRGLLSDSERSLMTGMIAGLIASIAAAIDNRANDKALVQRLREGGVLEDPDLIAAAYHRMLEFERERQRASEDMVTALAAGQELEVAHAVGEYLVWRGRRRDAYGNPVLDVDALPNSAVERLHWAVAAALRTEDSTREEVLETATLGVLAGLRDVPETAPVRAARLLLECGAVNAELLGPLIEMGEIVLFEALLARLCSIPILLIRRALFEPGGETLAIVAKAAALDQATLVTMLAAGRRVRPRDGDCPAALTLFDRLDPATARRALRAIARHPDFQEAIRRLEG